MKNFFSVENKPNMESSFEDVPPKIQKHIIEIEKLINERITESSPETKAINFLVDGETAEKRVSFKLIKSEDGNNSYVFDYLAW